MKFPAPRAAAFAAAAFVTVLALGSPATAAPAPATTTDPAAAAAGWLAQQFVDASNKPSPSGDHFTFPGSSFYYGGLTADAVFALAASKSGGDKIQAALAYIGANVATDANLGFGDQPGAYDGSVAKAALAAIVAGGDPTNLGGHNLLQALKDDECTAVSAPVDQNDFTTPTCPAVGAARNIFSSVSESLAILIEARGAAAQGAKYAPSTAAVGYFLSLQCKDGGFTGDTTAGATCTSSVDETGYAAAALAALGDHGTALANANAWLRSARNPAGYWVAQGGPDVDSTGLAVAALDAAGDDVAPSRAWLVSQQVTTGPAVGAGATRGALTFQGKFDASSSIKATADGLLGLAHGGSLATLTAAGAAAGTAVLAPSPQVTSASVTQGGKQTVTADGFAAGEQVSAVLHSTPVPLGSVTATKTGSVSISFTVPATLTPGAHQVVLTGVGSGLTATVRFTVRARAGVAVTGTTRSATPSTTAAPATEAPLAASGRDGRRAVQETLLGLGLVVAGAGALYAGRRRA